MKIPKIKKEEQTIIPTKGIGTTQNFMQECEKRNTKSFDLARGEIWFWEEEKKNIKNSNNHIK
jgi:hypothetical protein